MNQPKEVPPPEVSLKYMAWNVKEMSESIKKIQMLLEMYVNNQKSTVAGNLYKDHTQSNLPF